MTIRIRMKEDVSTKRRLLKKGHLVTVHYLLGKELLLRDKAEEYKSPAQIKYEKEVEEWQKKNKLLSTRKSPKTKTLTKTKTMIPTTTQTSEVLEVAVDKSA